MIGDRCSTCGDRIPRGAVYCAGCDPYTRAVLLDPGEREECAACGGSGGGDRALRCPHCGGTGRSREAVERDAEARAEARAEAEIDRQQYEPGDGGEPPF